MKVKVKQIPKANNGLQVEDNKFKMLSPLTTELGGEKHSNGGTELTFNGTTVEAEAGEPLSIDSEGNAVIYGNMFFPSTKKKFKTIAKDLAKEENDYFKQLDRGMGLINDKDPYDSYQSLGFNAGNVLADAAIQKRNVVNATKEMLGTVQNMILETADKEGKDPNDIVSSMKNGGQIKKYQEGGDIPNLEAFKNAIARQESSNNYTATPRDPKTGKLLTSAFGKYQFIESTRRNYYDKYFKEEFPSFQAFNAEFKSNPELQEKVMDVHTKELYNKFDGNLAYMALAHRLGEGAAKSIRDKGYYTIKGRRIDLDTPIGSSMSPTDKETPGQYLNKVGIDPSQYVDDSNYTTSSRREEPLKMLPLSNQIPTQREVPQPQQVNMSSVEQPVAVKTPGQGFRSKLGVADVLGELAAIADRPDYVPGQSYEPQPFLPYQVSFQDRLNQNNQTFAGLSRQLNKNPEALAILAAQKYQADTQTLAEQFRTNQGISNQVANQNTELFNSAQLQNLQLRDLQQQRQEQAKATTEDRRQQALTSLSNKVAQNRAVNNQYALMENFSGFRPDQNMQMQYQGPNAFFNTYGNESPQPLNRYATTQTVRDGQGNMKFTRVTDPSEIQKQKQDWELFQRFSVLSDQ